jgi:hypothetical protein
MSYLTHSTVSHHLHTDQDQSLAALMDLPASESAITLYRLGQSKTQEPSTYLIKRQCQLQCSQFKIGPPSQFQLGRTRTSSQTDIPNRIETKTISAVISTGNKKEGNGNRFLHPYHFKPNTMRHTSLGSSRGPVKHTSVLFTSYF